MIRHFHKDEDENTVWHDGSLADCPETEFFDVTGSDGKPALMAIGFSCARPDDVGKAHE